MLKGMAMHKFVCVIAVVVMAVTVNAASVWAQAQRDTTPMLTTGKFGVPVNPDVVQADWAARGYSLNARPYAPGWTRDAHTHPWNLLITLVSGKMEFTITDRRFEVRPGDELFYPANAVISARNMYDGTSQMLSGRQ